MVFMLRGYGGEGNVQSLGFSIQTGLKSFQSKLITAEELDFFMVSNQIRTPVFRSTCMYSLAIIW